MKIVFEIFDVKPAHVRFVVVIAFDTYKLPVTLIVLAALDMVRVFANRFVVVTAFETYTLPTTCKVELGVTVPIPTRPDEFITNTFDPLLTFENRTTFDPSVPGPTFNPPPD